MAIYARSLGYPLADFDDDVYLLRDPRLAALSLANLGRIFGKLRIHAQTTN